MARAVAVNHLSTSSSLGGVHGSSPINSSLWGGVHSSPSSLPPVLLPGVAGGGGRIRDRDQGLLFLLLSFQPPLHIDPNKLWASQQTFTNVAPDRPCSKPQRAEERVGGCREESHLKGLHPSKPRAPSLSSICPSPPLPLLPLRQELFSPGQSSKQRAVPLTGPTLAGPVASECQQQLFSYSLRH